MSQVQVPLARQPLAGLPKYAAKKLGQLRQEVLSRPEFDTTENIQRVRIEFEQKLVQFLDHARQSNQARIAEATPVLLVPTTSDNSLIQI